jgi:extracellular factor (EF) 3-hydroxypalmitic acid methyl ester biosynthesis protein
LRAASVTKEHLADQPGTDEELTKELGTPRGFAGLGTRKDIRPTGFVLVLGMIIAEAKLRMQETAAQTASATDVLEVPSVVNFKTSHGIKGQGTVVRLSPQSVTFEVYGPETVLRLSELLSEFEIAADTQSIYSGKAVVSSVVNSGSAAVCEAAISGPFPGLNSPEFHNPEMICQSGFSGFMSRWQKYYHVSRDYKVVVADLHTFLSNLRLWLEQVEVTVQSAPAVDRTRLEAEIAQGLERQVTSALSNMFERFEAIADKVEPDMQPVHRAFGQRQLHQHLLCAPFIYRTYAKPLGYAGDYEMMNMIQRDSLEGRSLYAKLVNAYMLDQAPAHAVRNRAKLLCDRIEEETIRVAAQGRRARIYSIACGPALEVEFFLAKCPFADRAEFLLLDFNEETLRYTGNRMADVKRQHARTTPVSVVKNSVQSLLKSAGKSIDEPKHDLIYCSGLYDYLNDRLIKALNTYLYDQLRPGGLLIVGNFGTNNPIKRIMEHALEWFLIYRNSSQLAALAPSQAAAEDCTIKMEPSGTHLFLEVRKPA